MSQTEHDGMRHKNLNIPRKKRAISFNFWSPHMLNQAWHWVEKHQPVNWCAWRDTETRCHQLFKLPRVPGVTSDVRASAFKAATLSESFRSNSATDSCVWFKEGHFRCLKISFFSFTKGRDGTGSLVFKRVAAVRDFLILPRKWMPTGQVAVELFWPQEEAGDPEAPLTNV